MPKIFSEPLVRVYNYFQIQFDFVWNFTTRSRHSHPAPPKRCPIWSAQNPTSLQQQQSITDSLSVTHNNSFWSVREYQPKKNRSPRTYQLLLVSPAPPPPPLPQPILLEPPFILGNFPTKNAASAAVVPSSIHVLLHPTQFFCFLFCFIIIASTSTSTTNRQPLNNLCGACLLTSFN